ncbi:hypothetical protein [Paenibacillus abyssi]|uniref:Helicase HerA central domain-containing protein n=1 Tax=Paenibacillus abyssi TaxID=1340531 RepID=A0A917FJD2_9BACL|nr:hypothetical protein [Paenibacillus abyssi]GGF88706.1 hypothetical protein GCM10010916_02510 [Paenibacillus abyssi]
MKFGDFLSVVHPEYVYLRLKPNNSIRNQQTHKIARAIGALYKNVVENVKMEEHRLIRMFGRDFVLGTKYTYTLPAKTSYYIYMERKRVEFYFVVPRQYLAYIREKLSDVWSGLTVDEVDTLPQFSDRATKYQLSYEKEDGLSLAADRRSNDLLTSNLNAVELLEDGDKLGIFYNFVPVSQVSWRHVYRATITKVNRRLPVDRDKFGVGYTFKMALAFLDLVFREVGEVLSGSVRKTESGANVLESLIERLNGARQISESTAKKANSTVIDTQIVVMAESPDAVRQRNAARSLAQSFDTITDDNRLAFKPYRRTFTFTDRDIRAERNKVGDQEAQNFITLAGREMLERYNFIERIETHETEVPEDLREGALCIGENTYRGTVQPAYLSSDREFQNLTLVLIGPTRAGKSTLIANLCRDAINIGECAIIFDYVGQCELSREVAATLPPDRVLNIDCNDYRTMQGLGYNEVVGKSADPFEAYDNAKKQTTQLLTLVNSINADETRLTAKMQRYLVSAALITFISGGNIRSVFDCLQDHETRAELISAIPPSQTENLRKYTRWLAELDEYDKKGNVTGTKDTYVVGIIDRLNQLEQNAYVEKMLDKDTRGNIDLVTEMQRNQIICIRMPSDMFSTDSERDVYTTYWSTKIWLALQMRSKRFSGDRAKFTKVNLVVDELYQVAHTEQFMRSKLSQYAKFGLKPIISAHYLNQIRHIRDELRSANASYMLISGCDKKNYEELKSELYPYTEEDLLRLPRFHSLNLVKNKDGYARFITKLPPPIN